jgi:choline-glycine betaine transporter
MKKKINWVAISNFAFSSIWVVWGIRFIIKNQAVVGEHRDESLNVVGGWLILFVGIIFLYVSYHSLSPHGKIRSFFEDQPIRKKKNKD